MFLCIIQTAEMHAQKSFLNFTLSVFHNNCVVIVIATYSVITENKVIQEFWTEQFHLFLTKDRCITSHCYTCNVINNY